MKYIAIIPNYWGKADTREAAIRNARKAGASITRRTPLAVYEVEDDEASVDPISGGIYAKRGTRVERIEGRNLK